MDEVILDNLSVFQRTQEQFLKCVHEETTDKRTGNTGLHDHQIDALIAAERHFQNVGNRTALIVLPTGCGKSGIAVLVSYILGAHRVLIITPSLKITKQLGDDIAVLGKCFLRRTLMRDFIQENVAAYLPSTAAIHLVEEIKTSLNSDVMITNVHKIGGRSSVTLDDIPNDKYDLVIVDEAHHYPATTWTQLVDHFTNSKRVFLTATNYNNGKTILQEPPCFEESREVMMGRGIIRRVDLDDEIPLTAEVFYETTRKINGYLRQHDAKDPNIKHQAMVLTQRVIKAEAFRDCYNFVHQELGSPFRCETLTGPSSVRNDGVLRRFDANHTNFRTLVVVGKLLEGYDNRNVSVVAIVRKVSPESKVLFTQFVGRAVRKASRDDPVDAVIVSHPIYEQRRNFENFDRIAEADPVDEQIED